MGLPRWILVVVVLAASTLSHGAFGSHADKEEKSHGADNKSGEKKHKADKLSNSNSNDSNNKNKAADKPPKVDLGTPSGMAEAAYAAAFRAEKQFERGHTRCEPFSPSDPSPRMLVTGGAGFVGSHMVERLLEEYPKATIKVVDNLWRGRLRNLVNEKTGVEMLDFLKHVCVEDLTEPEVAVRLTKHAEAVFHLADIVAGIDFVFSNQPFVFDKNLLINLNTIRAARENGVKEFVYAGTACSFPKNLQSSYNVTRIPERLTYPANPESAYGWSKLMGEYELELFNDQAAGFNVGIVRFHNLYGPRSPYTQGSQVLPSVIHKCIGLYTGENVNKQGLVVWGSGRQYRDFLYIDDAVDGVLATYRNGMNKGVVQIGTGDATTIKNAAFEIAKVAEALLGPLEVSSMNEIKLESKQLV